MLYTILGNRHIFQQVFEFECIYHVFNERMSFIFLSRTLYFLQLALLRYWPEIKIIIWFFIHNWENYTATGKKKTAIFMIQN